MAGDTQREGIAETERNFGKGLFQLFGKAFGFLEAVGMRYGKAQFFGFGITLEASGNIFAYRFLHRLFRLGQTARQGKLVQLFALDLEDGFNLQNGADRRGRGGYPSAFFEIFHRVERDINGRIETGLL